MIDKALSVDGTAKVYLIVHGRRNLLKQLEEILEEKGFYKVNMELATLDKAGIKGEYVAMLWPPLAPTQVIISQIIGIQRQAKGIAMEAWKSVVQKELNRIPLE